MITVLDNPKSNLYLELKQLINSERLPWFYDETTTHNNHSDYDNVSFYSHSFLKRPSWNGIKMYPEVSSGFINLVHDVLVEVVNFNNLTLNSFIRINANCVHPTKTNNLTVPHYDHQFDHFNILLYLNNAGGETVVLENDNRIEHHPKEDDIILFQGLHCHRPPKENRRIVLVATFI